MGKTTRRSFLGDSFLAAAGVAAVPAFPGAAGAIERASRPTDILRVGVIGVRGRGRAHVGAFKRSADSEVVAICDPDEAVIDGAMRAAPKAAYFRDIREMLEDDSIDAVSIATPNHWHSLAAIWAMQAGKHVYVEKPLSHNVFEGHRVVEAARKYNRICQHGTQGRSMDATRAAIQWLRDGGLGEVKIARALCYKRRKSIGKVDGPQTPPASLDYDLWTGPADLQPLMRKNLHYDWHWVFNTGNGDIGNQGVHQMDIARWGLGVEGLPPRIESCGARLGYEDDGNTPNTQISVLDWGDRQIIFEVRGLVTPAYKTAHIGVVFHCEHGYLVSSSYTKLHAYDHDGKVIKTFQGDGSHFQNFLDAVKQGDPGTLNAESKEGHLSSAMCHLGNISYQMGRGQRLNATDSPFGEAEAGNESFRRFREHLVANGVDASTEYAMGPSLSFEGGAHRFVGERADEANALVSRKYRAPYVVPDQV